jgi:glycosyltransferase involved in cell wall biosynthesis
MNRKPRVLFLAFYFPPIHAVASVRAAKIAKHLSLAGWDVSAVTPHPSLLRLTDDADRVAAELQHWGVRLIYTGHRWRCLSSGYLKRPYGGIGWFGGAVCRWIARKMDIDETAGWFREAYRACADLDPGQVDVILATGGPWGTFAVAQKLSQRLRRPFVLDYRDPWTTSSAHDSRYQTPHWRLVESRLLAEASSAVVVSPTMGASLSEAFPILPKIEIVPNGYDPEELAGIAPYRFGHFAVVYAGKLYPPVSTATPLVAALKRFLAIMPQSDCRLHYYGGQGDHVLQQAVGHGVSQRVVVHGEVSRREALAATGGANVAAVVVSSDDHGSHGVKGILTGKIFEPVGLGVPVLLVAPPDADARGVVETAGRGRSFVASDTDGMAAYLADLAQGRVPESRQPEVYAWPNLIQKFDATLRQAIRTHHDS